MCGVAIEVTNYIRRHISEPITAEKIAESLFVSRSYLSRKFKAETGESLTDYILKEKTEEAKRFLRFSDKPLTVIGAYPGFSSPSHFSRVFKTYVGTTLREYQEKHTICRVYLGRPSSPGSLVKGCHFLIRHTGLTVHRHIPPSSPPSRAGAACRNGHHKVGSFLILRSRYRKKHTFSTMPTAVDVGAAKPISVRLALGRMLMK